MVIPGVVVMGSPTMTTIAQLSDLHISDEDPRPAVALREAVAALLALPTAPDCVVLTGDLADHGRPAEYARIRAELEPLPMPVYPLPGNHDDVGALLAAFPDLPGPNHAVRVNDVRLLCCDSTIPGEPGGDLSDPDWLDARLAEAPGVPAVVAMHHPPYAIGMRWIDAMGHADPDRLATVVGRHPQVVRVIAGHVHAGSVTAFAGTVATTCPSTYRQTYVDPGVEPMLSDAKPGFALHLVRGNTAVTHFRPVGETPVPAG